MPSPFQWLRARSRCMDSGAEPSSGRQPPLGKDLDRGHAGEQGASQAMRCRPSPRPRTAGLGEAERVVELADSPARSELQTRPGPTTTTHAALLYYCLLSPLRLMSIS